LIKKGDLLLNDPACDEKLQQWISAIKGRIGLRNDILIEEMIKEKKKIESDPSD
jgi:hypothetical protein